MATPKNIAFYVSGHGFGHSTRVIEVIRQLSAETRVLVKTSAPEWLYAGDLSRGFEFVELQHDIGCVQIDSLQVDTRKTLQAFAKMWKGKDALIKREAKLLVDGGVDLVVSDISPLACLIADAANLPCVVIANFTWDWIYEPFVKENPDLTDVIGYIRDAYTTADLCLRTPFHGGITAFANIEDIPVIGRHSHTPRDQTREKLGIDSRHRRDHRLVLLTFGGFQTRTFPLDWSAKLENATVVTTLEDVEEGPNILKLDRSAIRHPDLVAACDLVVSKPGYGILSESAVNQVPVLFVKRYDFREAEVMQERVQEMGAGRVVEVEDVLAGRLGQHIMDALDAGLAWPEMRTDGGEVAARRIEEKAQALP